MYNHILLPVEIGGPGNTKRAVEVAKALLSDGGRLTLLNVVEPLPNAAEAFVEAGVSEQIKKNAKARLEAAAEELGVENTALLSGAVGRSIVDWAEQNATDCIVMASHRPVMSDIILGSTAAWVVRHANAAVHVLR
ncbi:MAG: universal stress protein [Pseudomonadota bacterium]